MANPKKTADDGRVVITLKYKITKDQRNEIGPQATDAVDVLRSWVAAYRAGDMALDQFIASAVSVEVDAAK